MHVSAATARDAFFVLLDKRHQNLPAMPSSTICVFGGLSVCFALLVFLLGQQP
jgi:hypothetical protein